MLVVKNKNKQRIYFHGKEVKFVIVSLAGLVSHHELLAPLLNKTLHSNDALVRRCINGLVA